VYILLCFAVIIYTPATSFSFLHIYIIWPYINLFSYICTIKWYNASTKYKYNVHILLYLALQSGGQALSQSVHACILPFLCRSLLPNENCSSVILFARGNCLESKIWLETWVIISQPFRVSCSTNTFLLQVNRIHLSHS
jgi:hypothetical protein